MNQLLSLVHEPWALALGWSLLHFLWQGAVLALLAWLLLALLRSAPAKARYGTACVFLLLMAVAPVATFLLLHRKTPALAEPVHVTVTAAAGPAVASSLAPTLAQAPLALRVKTALDPALPWLLGTWALGVLVLSTRFFASWARVQRLRRHSASPVPAEWHLVLSRLCRELKLSRTVRLLQSAAVEVPTALGWLCPIILLPACALTGLAPLQLEAILAHELAHIRRGDFLVNLLQSLVEVVLFYHPAVWWLSGRIRAERELCCDDVAAALCGDPLILARALTDLEALREPAPSSYTHLALAANGGSLMHRVRHLLQPTTPTTSSARTAALALLTASLLGAAGVAFQDKDKEASPKADQATRIKVIDGDRHMDVRLEGEVQLDPAAKEPVTVPGAGRFRVEEKKDGKARTYTATRDQRTYAVDGQEKPLDAEGEAWLRTVVKDAARAQAGRDKAQRVIQVRTRHLEAREQELDAHGRELEARTRELESQMKDLEHRAQSMTPEEQAALKADGERLKADGEKLKVEGERLKAEAERFKNDPELKALIDKARAEGRRVRMEVLRKEGEGPGAVIIRKDGAGKDVVVKRFKATKEGASGEAGEWAYLGPEGEEVIIEGLDKEIRIPPIHLPEMRLGHLPAMDPEGHAQLEMAAIKAELKALQTRLDQLQRQMATTPKAPKPPKAPPTPEAAPLPPPPPAAPKQPGS